MLLTWVGTYKHHSEHESVSKKISWALSFLLQSTQKMSAYATPGHSS